MHVFPPNKKRWEYRVLLTEKFGTSLVSKYHDDVKKDQNPNILNLWHLTRVYTWKNIVVEISRYIDKNDTVKKGFKTKANSKTNDNNISKQTIKTTDKTQASTSKTSDSKAVGPKNKNSYKKVNYKKSNKKDLTPDKDIKNFYMDLGDMQNTKRPQAVVNIIKDYDNKPIVKIDLFGRPIVALVDSGAEVSVVNLDFIKKYDATWGYSRTSLSSPLTGSSVEGYFTEVQLKIGGIKFYQRVCVAPMSDPEIFQMIMGYDMLTKHEALVDTKNSKLRLAVDKTSSRPDTNDSGIECNYIATDVKTEELAEILKLVKLDNINISNDQKNKFVELVSSYQNILIEDVTKMKGADLEPYSPKFKSETPIYQRQYRIPHSMFTPLRKKLDKFEAAGIIKRANSQWNSPVLAVRKPDGIDVRMVLDLRKLNEIIEPLPYPLMRIEDIINRLGGSKVFSNLDLNNGYFNIKLADEVKERFAFTTPWGRFAMQRLPQGCVTSASVFQQIMNNALHDLIGKGHVFVFQDDVIVHTATVDEHILVLDELFSALQKLNMAVRPSKCEFFKSSIKFLGHIISEKGSKPSDENVKAIRLFERPRTVKQVRSFLGTVNFYRKFIEDVTTLAAPLYNLIKKNQTKITWTDDCNKSFILLKEALISAPVLAYPDFSQPFVIKADASDEGVGGVLEQCLDGETHPIAYCSRKLNRAEKNYSVIEREALAIVYVLLQFRYLVYGYPVILKTDHKPLSYIFKLKDTNQRLIRWLLHIQDYQLQIEHISGKTNYVADMLSRSDESAESHDLSALKVKHDAISNERIKSAQEADTECKTLIENVNNNIYLEKEYMIDEFGVLVKLVFPTRAHGWRYRVVLPLSLRDDVIFNYHDRIYSGHLSIQKVIWKIKQIFTWETMFTDISNYIKSCEFCQRRNTTRTKAPFQPVAPPTQPMERINVDILGPFSPTKNRMKYLVLYTDSLTRFVIGSALPNIEAATVTKDYIDNVFSVHGGSREILSDRGGQFTSGIFQGLCKRLSIKHVMTSSYRPSSNGIAERTNQKVLRILAHVCNKYYSDWDEKLPYVLHAIRTSPNRSTGDSPFYLLHGFDPIDPAIEPHGTFKEKHSTINEFVENNMKNIEISRAIVADNLTLSSQRNCDARNEGRKLKEFYVGQQVLYHDMASYAGKNRKLRPRYKGPYRIVERLGLVNYRIRNLSDIKDIRNSHVDKLKIYYPRLVLDDVDSQPSNKPRAKNNDSDNVDEPTEQQRRDEEDDMFFDCLGGDYSGHCPDEAVDSNDIIDQPDVTDLPLQPDFQDIPIELCFDPVMVPTQAPIPATPVPAQSPSNLSPNAQAFSPTTNFPDELVQTEVDLTSDPIQDEAIPSTSTADSETGRIRHHERYDFRPRTHGPKTFDL